MIHNPQVLILDEPTSGLDPNQLDDIRKLIVQIGKEKTVMLSTHIMQEVEAICTRTIIINKGNIVADSPTAALRKGSASSGYELFVEFSGAVSKSTLKQLAGVIEINTVSENTYTILTGDERDIRKEIAELAQKEGHSILTMTRKEQRLEDVFKQLTQ
jgi:ABC-2 type transport system ATP-binding protein